MERILGPVTALELIAAPLTGRPCVCYAVTVEQFRNTGHAPSWVPILHETAGVPFVVDDGAGRARVDPTHARITLVGDGSRRSGTFDELTEGAIALLDRHGVSGTDQYGMRKALRYHEGVLEPGERVAVTGLSVRELDPDGAAAIGGYRDPAPTRRLLSGSPETPLTITDDP